MQTVNKQSGVVKPIAETRCWRHMDGMHNIGRFLPDSRFRTEDERKLAEERRDKERDEKIVDTEACVF